MKKSCEHHSGFSLINNPLKNKGTAFSLQERLELNLVGLLPPRVETLAEQVTRSYTQFCSYKTKMQQNIFLHDLFATNVTLFYNLVATHIKEILPILYTPNVANAVTEYSNEFRRPQGLYISYHDQKNLNQIFANFADDIELIVVTDGEGVLGIGDQGIGAIEIPIAKLMLYSLFGGINPAKVLPITLDVGTNNEILLQNPNYLGLREKRISGKPYQQFIAAFISSVKQKFPNVFLHFEDFGRDNAADVLTTYRDKLCAFNDDIQGTAVVTLAALLAALRATNQTLENQRVVIFGAGTAGIGILEQILDAMLRHGITKKDALQKFWLLDKHGLLTNKSSEITPEQKPYLRDSVSLKDNLFEVVKNVKPTILIGCSTAKGAFTKEIIQEMAKNVEHPIIFPLSNPTEKCEALPEDLLAWTNGKAKIATGSPFSPVIYQNKEFVITQCNNAFAFPGIGLGILAVKAKRLTNNMLFAAVNALLELSPALKIETAPLLPKIENAKEAAIKIALSVAKEAQKEEVALIKNPDIEKLIADYFWEAQY